MEQPDITHISCTRVDNARLGGKPLLSPATRKAPA